MIESEQWPTTVEGTLAVCNASAFPNVRALLQIFAVLPVTVASSERSFSSLKGILTAFRSTMGEDRLVGLTLMSIHSALLKDIDPATVTAKYFVDHPRRNA